MTAERYVLVGADPRKKASANPGGMLTLSTGLIAYAHAQGHTVDVINTLRPGFEELSFFRRLTAGMGRALELLRILRRGRYRGVIIFSGAGWSFFERILLSGIARWLSVKDLFVIVDGWFLEVRNAGFLKRHLIGLLLRIPHRLTASGQRWSELFRGLGVKPERIVGVHYWLPDSFAVAREPKTAVVGGTVRFIFVGWMIAEKGIYELLAAIAELRSRHQFSFTFVGGGTLLEHVRQRIRDAGWVESVSALGWVPEENFQEVLAAADVYVLPSYAEGFPMSLIEAFSKGLPAIATDVGGISDSLRDGLNGYLVPPRQIPPLVEAMERYLRNPEIIGAQSRAAIKTVMVKHNARENCELFFKALS